MQEKIDKLKARNIKLKAEIDELRRVNEKLKTCYNCDEYEFENVLGCKHKFKGWQRSTNRCLDNWKLGKSKGRYDSKESI